jgi:prepilin-type processing-associated H-X9-DG protein
MVHEGYILNQRTTDADAGALKIFRCPSDKRREPDAGRQKRSYAMNVGQVSYRDRDKPWRLSAIQTWVAGATQPLSTTVFLTDRTQSTDRNEYSVGYSRGMVFSVSTASPIDLTAGNPHRDGKTLNLLYYDGHVEKTAWATRTTLQWNEPGSPLNYKPPTYYAP